MVGPVPLVFVVGVPACGGTGWGTSVASAVRGGPVLQAGWRRPWLHDPCSQASCKAQAAPGLASI